jgi:hypothetical protein
MSYLYELQKISKNPGFREKLAVKLNISMTITQDIWSAFKAASHKLYPVLGPDEKIVSARQAEKDLDGRLTRYLILKKGEEKILRKAKEGFYKKEIDLLKIVLDLKDSFVRSGAILPTEDISGKQVLAVIPASITIQGKSKLDQEFEAMKMLLQEPVIREIIKTLNLTK